MSELKPVSSSERAPSFEIDMHLEDRVVTPSDMTASSAPIVLAAIRAFLKARPGDLTIDLARVPALCEAGANAIAEVVVSQRAAGFTSHVINVSAQARLAMPPRPGPPDPLPSRVPHRC